MGNIGTVVLPRHLILRLICIHIPVARYLELPRTHIESTLTVAGNPPFYNVRVCNGRITATGRIGDFPIRDIVR